METRFSAPV